MDTTSTLQFLLDISLALRKKSRNDITIENGGSNEHTISESLVQFWSCELDSFLCLWSIPLYTDISNLASKVLKRYGYQIKEWISEHDLSENTQMKMKCLE